MTEHPDHICGGNYHYLNKENHKYKEVITDCHQRCQQNGVNIHRRACLVCISAKQKQIANSQPKDRRPPLDQRSSTDPNTIPLGSQSRKKGPPTSTVSNQIGVSEHQRAEEESQQFHQDPFDQTSDSWAPRIPLFSNQLQLGENPYIRTQENPPCPLPGTPEALQQLPSGSGSQLLETVEIRNRDGDWVEARILYDSGADLTATDMDFATSLGLTPCPTPGKYQVTTIHGTTGIASQFTLTFRMQGALRSAKFLGIEKLARRYPGHRLTVPDKLLRKFNLKKDILYQDASVVNLLVGSNSSSLFPTVLYQQDNLIIARSKFTGKFLIQGATKSLGFPNQYLAAQTLQLNTLQFDDSRTPQSPGADVQPHRGPSPSLQEAIDDAANAHEEEELVDLGLDYTPDDMHINFPTLALQQLKCLPDTPTPDNEELENNTASYHPQGIPEPLRDPDTDCLQNDNNIPEPTGINPARVISPVKHPLEDLENNRETTETPPHKTSETLHAEQSNDFISPNPPCTYSHKEHLAHHAALAESRAISELAMPIQHEFNRHLEEARAAQALEPWSTIVQKFPELTNMAQKFVPEWYSCSTTDDAKNNQHKENTQINPRPKWPLTPYKVPRNPPPHHYPITGLHTPE